MEFITKETKQYKANLHSHTNLSDGCLSPAELAELYRCHGYSVLAVTDHEASYDHSAFSREDFLLLTGYEAYLRTDENCRMAPYGGEVHLNLLAKEPHNTALVCFDPKFCKYMPHSLAEEREHIGPEGRHSYDTEFINLFLRTAREAGYLVTYNHPCWSMEEPERILEYDGFFSLEIFNTNSMTVNGFESNMALYDRLLRHGKHVFLHGADDNHNKLPLTDPLSDSFGAWTMILAPELSYAAVIEALEKGNFYASTGPEITSLRFEGALVQLECSAAKRIIMHMSPKICRSAYHSDGSAVTAAEFEIPESAPYVYFSVIGTDGTAAHTRAFWREELGI